MFRAGSPGDGYAWLLGNYPHPGAEGGNLTKVVMRGGGVASAEVVKLPFAIEAGREYAIETRLRGDRIVTLVDGQVVDETDRRDVRRRPDRIPRERGTARARASTTSASPRPTAARPARGRLRRRPRAWERPAPRPRGVRISADSCGGQPADVAVLPGARRPVVPLPERPLEQPAPNEALATHYWEPLRFGAGGAILPLRCGAAFDVPLAGAHPGADRAPAHLDQTSGDEGFRAHTDIARNIARAQTFTAGRTGTLTRVAYTTHQAGHPTAPLTLRLTEMDAGGRPSDVLAERTLAPADVSWSPSELAIEPGVQVQAGPALRDRPARPGDATWRLRARVRRRRPVRRRRGALQRRRRHDVAGRGRPRPEVRDLGAAMRSLALALCALAALAATASAAPPTPPGSDPAPKRFSARDFAHPTSQDRPNAFWFWNGALSEDELERQLHLMRAKGVEEFFIHPRQGLGGVFGQTENDYYLSRDYFDKVEFVLDRARRLGMHVWLYDDLNWPSGYAGGRVLGGGEVDGRQVEGDPDLVPRYLQLRAEDVEGPRTYDEPVPDGGGEGWSVADGELLTAGGEVGLTRAGEDWSDYRMEFDATIEDVSVGWALRARDKANLIMVNLTSSSENNPEAASSFGVHVRENGGYRLLARIPAGRTIEENTTYRVATEVEGSTLRLFLDGEQVATLDDPAFGALDAGRAGFRSDGNGGERARIDDLRISAGGGDAVRRRLLRRRPRDPLRRPGRRSGPSRWRRWPPACPRASSAPRATGDRPAAARRRVDDELTGRVRGRPAALGRARRPLVRAAPARSTGSLNYHPDLEPENRYVDMLNPAATRAVHRHHARDVRAPLRPRLRRA